MALDGTADGFKPIWDSCRAWYAGVPGVPLCNHASDVLMYAIAGQEGGWRFRVQSGNGPAHGLWQFERGGGVTGVLNHPSSEKSAFAVCSILRVAPTPKNVWQAMTVEGIGDELAFAFARLLLWTDPHALPDPADDDETWAYYQRNWRPGAPHRSAWTHNVSEARRVLK